MSELDNQLAQIKADADSKAAAIVAEAKAKENAATFTQGALSNDQLLATVEQLHAEMGRSAPHPAIAHLFALTKHLFAKVNALDQPATGSTTPAPTTPATPGASTPPPTAAPPTPASSSTPPYTPAS